MYGNCYTFNSGWGNQTVEQSHRTGRRYGLRVTLNVGTAEYLSTGENAAGIRVVLHDQSKMPFPDDDGYLGRPGTLLSMGIKKVPVVICYKKEREKKRRMYFETDHLAVDGSFVRIWVEKYSLWGLLWLDQNIWSCT